MFPMSERLLRCMLRFIVAQIHAHIFDWASISTAHYGVEPGKLWILSYTEWSVCRPFVVIDVLLRQVFSIECLGRIHELFATQLVFFLSNMQYIQRRYGVWPIGEIRVLLTTHTYPRFLRPNKTNAVYYLMNLSRILSGSVLAIFFAVQHFAHH